MKNTLNFLVMTTVNNQKIQKKAIGTDGSFFNQLMGNNETLPVVGEGATILLYSDRHAYDVIAVSEDGNRCTLRRCKAKRTDGLGMSESQSYTYTADENGGTMELVWKQKRGKEYGEWVEEITKIDWLPALYKQAEAEGLPGIVGMLTPEDIEAVCGKHFWPVNVVPGLTKARKVYHDVSVLFGVRKEYFDFSF